MSSLARSFYAIPPITRTFVAVCTITMLSNTARAYMDWEPFMVLNYHQYWRIVTCFFISEQQGGLSNLFELYSFYTSASAIELKKFASRPADFLYYIVITGSILIAGSPYTGAFGLFTSLSCSILFTSGRYEPDAIIRILFWQVKAKYWPYFDLFLTAAMSPMLIPRVLFGFAAALVYSCLENKSTSPILGFFKIPFGMESPDAELKDRSFLSAPEWFASFVNLATRIINTVSGATPSNPNAIRFAGKKPFEAPRFQGKGRRLGTS